MKTKVRSSKNVPLISLRRPGGKYDKIRAKMVKLKPGQCLVVEVEKGLTARTIQNRLNAALRRLPVTAPKGCRFEKHTTEDGDVAIQCVRKKR